MRRRDLLLLAFPWVCLTACGRGVPDVSDPSHPITVRAGQAFRITLASNPTTGYSWRLAAPLPTALALVDSRYFPGPGALAHLAGAGGREVWTFQAVRRGAGEIRLEYARSGGPAGRTATFTVQVD